jgi:hypothetical protein
MSWYPPVIGKIVPWIFENTRTISANFLTFSALKIIVQAVRSLRLYKILSILLMKKMVAKSENRRDNNEGGEGYGSKRGSSFHHTYYGGVGNRGIKKFEKHFPFAV